MIGCDFCEEWYHAKCLNLSDSKIEELEESDWQCPQCPNAVGNLSPLTPSPIAVQPVSTMTNNLYVKNRSKNINTPLVECKETKNTPEKSKFQSIPNPKMWWCFKKDCLRKKVQFPTQMELKSHE